MEETLLTNDLLKWIIELEEQNLVVLISLVVISFAFTVSFVNINLYCSSNNALVVEYTQYGTV